MTKLGQLTADICAGHEVSGVSEGQMHRLCHDFARMTPPRYLRCHRGADQRYRVALTGPPVEGWRGHR